MKDSNITKTVGYNLIEERDKIHKFIVDDKYYPRLDLKFAILNDIIVKMKLDVSTTDLNYAIEKICLM